LPGWWAVPVRTQNERYGIDRFLNREYWVSLKRIQDTQVVLAFWNLRSQRYNAFDLARQFSIHAAWFLFLELLEVDWEWRAIERGWDVSGKVRLSRRWSIILLKYGPWRTHWQRRWSWLLR
jgi:hypothetical protein